MVGQVTGQRGTARDSCRNRVLSGSRRGHRQTEAAAQSTHHESQTPKVSHGSPASGQWPFAKPGERQVTAPPHTPSHPHAQRHTARGQPGEKKRKEKKKTPAAAPRSPPNRHTDKQTKTHATAHKVRRDVVVASIFSAWLLPLTRNNVAAAPPPALHPPTSRSTAHYRFTRIHTLLREEKDAAEESCQGGEDYAREAGE